MKWRIDFRIWHWLHAFVILGLLATTALALDINDLVANGSPSKSDNMFLSENEKYI